MSSAIDSWEAPRDDHPAVRPRPVGAAQGGAGGACSRLKANAAATLAPSTIKNCHGTEQLGFAATLTAQLNHSRRDIRHLSATQRRGRLDEAFRRSGRNTRARGFGEYLARQRGSHWKLSSLDASVAREAVPRHPELDAKPWRRITPVPSRLPPADGPVTGTERGGRDTCREAGPTPRLAPGAVHRPGVVRATLPAAPLYARTRDADETGVGVSTPCGWRSYAAKLRAMRR